MHVKDLAEHHEGLSYHYILKCLRNYLRSGKLILFGKFTPTKENGGALYYHSDIISNQMGGSTARKRLYRGYSNKILV